MRHYTVTGMSCAACSARVEKAVGSIDGVTECAVSLLTNSMTVSGDVSDETVITAVKNAGYGAFCKDAVEKNADTTDHDELADHETPILKKRLTASLVFLLILMYISMGHGMFGFPLPAFLTENPAVQGLAQLLLTVIVMVINQKFFVNGFKGLLHRSPNMDTLVGLGSAAAFGYSTVMLFAMLADSPDHAAHYLHEFYFESAAMILTLITVGKMLEARSKGKTTTALKSLMKLSPKVATLYQDESEIQVPIDTLKIGDVFCVCPGESIPTDGVIVYGHSAVNESAFTGESIPVDKSVGDTVSGGTVNTSGYIRCQVTHVGVDTVLSKIIRMVTDASAGKAPIAKIADKVSGVFVPVVILIAAITILVWLLCGETVGFALARGISVLVISCPCALGLATPVAIMVASGVGAKNGILFKTAASLEETGRVKTVVLDKTGTITSGEPVVTDLLPVDGVTENALMTFAASLEKMSEHPLAKAVKRYGTEHGVKTHAVEEFEALPGNGLKGVLDGKALYGGNREFIAQFVKLPDMTHRIAEKLADLGKTPLYFAYDSKFLGIIAVSDSIKEDSPKAIKALKDIGLNVVMLTGDNSRTANAIAKIVGVDTVVAGVKPDGKLREVQKLAKDGKVAMVGDGINDAPALTSADIGIAIGAGTDVAMDAADIVLMKSSLRDVVAAIGLSRKTLRTIHENLFWAFIYNVIGIPLAAGVFIPVLGWEMNPMFGAAAMSLSSFCVVSNALRINLFKTPIQTSTENKISESQSAKEKKAMTKTMKIEGMMCPHCEARVKKVLEELDGVETAETSHEKGTAVVTLTNDLQDDILKKTVEDQGYKVLGIE